VIITVVVPAKAPAKTSATSQRAFPFLATASAIPAFGSIVFHGTIPTHTTEMNR